MNKPQQFVVLVDSKNSQERQTNSRYSMADSNSVADLCPEKATELRRGDSGFFSAGTTPLTPYKELNGLAQNGTMTDESRKVTAKAIPSDVKDDLLSAFCCRQENETNWGDCSHSHCNNTRTQLEHFKSCSPANSTTQNCEQCTSFQRLVLSHAMNCRNSDGSCPVPMCSDAKMKLTQYSQKRRSSTSDLTQLPPTTMQRKGSVGSFFLKQNLSSAPSYVVARNDLTAAGIGSLPSKLVTDLKTKVEEIVLQLEKQSLTEDDYHTPESSIPSRPSTLHHSTQSGVSKVSGISGQGDIQYVPPLASQGMLSPIAEVPSPDVEPSPAVYYPLQHLLHTLDPDHLSKGRDHFYYQSRDYMVNDVAPLGEGGFGTCVVGQDKATESIFAMKRNNRDDMDKIESIRAECRMLARLRGGHDNIVQFYGAIMEENEKEYPPRLCKMFMEFAENGNLYSMLEDEEGDHTPLPVDQSLYYLQQILQAVHYLHSNSILHCDIKSLNILVFNNGRVVKLADFGSAIHVEEIPTMGAAKLKGCTPFFTAPEVVYQHQPTFSADVWSTLCVFVEMLTAKLPGCYKVQRNQNSMLYLVGKYTDDQIELLVPLSELQLDPSVAELFHKVFRRDHTQRPTALQLLNHPQILDACEYEKYFDLEYEGEYMEEYEPDQQQTQQLDSDEESFHTAPSNILNIPTEEMPKPGKRACGSMDSGVGDGGRSSFSSSCSGSLRGREYDSGLDTPGSVDVSSASRRFTFASRWRVQPPSFIQEEMEDEGREHCLEKSFSCPDSSLNILEFRKRSNSCTYHSNTGEYHSLPATVNEGLPNQVYQMNMADTTRSASVRRKRPSSIQPLMHSNSAPVMFEGSREVCRRFSLGALHSSYDDETDGVQNKPTLRRTSSELYVDKGPEVDTPEDKKQMPLDPTTHVPSSRPSSSLSVPSHHQYSSQNSSVYSQIIKRPRSDSAPATTTVTRPWLKEGVRNAQFKLVVASEPESTTQGLKKSCEDQGKQLFHII